MDTVVPSLSVTSFGLRGHGDDAFVSQVDATVTPPLSSPVLSNGISAVTRSWSDVDHRKLLLTFVATSFSYSLLGQPFFLAIARQQCFTGKVTAMQVMQDVVRTDGLRGLYRGAGISIIGTVLSELVYYFVVEYFKEKLPFAEREWRAFGAGFMADFISTPVFNPFGVLSQVQMVAGSALACEQHQYTTAWRTARTLIREQGLRCLFRGTMLTIAAAPLTGAWWFVYEYIKQRAYAVAPAVGSVATHLLPSHLLPRIPACCTSSTDNLLVNCSVGASASTILGVLMNPLYVLRLRLQVAKNLQGVRNPSLYLMKQIFLMEGVGAFYKGLRTNLLVSVVGGCAFGMSYEGAKQFSDNTAAPWLRTD